MRTQCVQKVRKCRTLFVYRQSRCDSFFWFFDCSCRKVTTIKSKICGISTGIKCMRNGCGLDPQQDLKKQKLNKLYHADNVLLPHYLVTKLYFASLQV